MIPTIRHTKTLVHLILGTLSSKKPNTNTPNTEIFHYLFACWPTKNPFIELTKSSKIPPTL